MPFLRYASTESAQDGRAPSPDIRLQTAASERFVRISFDLCLSRRSGLRITHEVEQPVGSRERRACRLFPIDLELFRRLDCVLFTFADDGDVVAFADDLDESRNIPD